MTLSRLRKHLGAGCFGIVLMGAVPGLAVAQTPDLRPGNFELGLYGGASYGADNFRPMGGFNVSYSLPKLLLPYGEFSYFPALVRNYSTPQVTYLISSRIVDFHAGVHIRILPHESRVVPYGVVGIGVLGSHTTGTETSAGVPPATYDQTSTDPAVNFGAGLRVYHTSYLGYRAEYKLYRPLSGPFTNFFSKVEGGIFFQFGRH
jgi:hypothetical protein